MTQIKIKEDTKEGKALLAFIRTLPFVEIIAEDSDTKISTDEFLSDFKESLKEVKNKKAKPLKDLFSDQ